MALLKRKKTDDSKLPKEVKEYYEAEKRDRVGVASLLAVGTLIATILLVIGLFFGGRWVWRHTVDRDKGSEGVATVQAPDDVASSSTNTRGNSDTNASSTSTSTTTPSTSTTSSTTTAGKTNTSATNLPDTGAASVLPAVLAVALFGVLIAELYQRKTNRR